MTQNVLTADVIADQALEILDNNCIAAKLVYRGYEDEFDKNVSRCGRQRPALGGKGGSTSACIA